MLPPPPNYRASYGRPTKDLHSSKFLKILNRNNRNNKLSISQLKIFLSIQIPCTSPRTVEDQLLRGSIFKYSGSHTVKTINFKKNLCNRILMYEYAPPPSITDLPQSLKHFNPYQFSFVKTLREQTVSSDLHQC